ncbi:hypothetical protein [Sphingomonas humi]|uniref:Flagellar FliJ protein n=1 Tax=Sphingomonas humi TaxID=335630 RepID=A0ABP7RQX5_9SPHN
MSRLAPALRLRRRQLDALAVKLAAEQAAIHALAEEAHGLSQRRTVERYFAAAAPAASDAWFSHSARRIAGLTQDRAAAELRLAELRHQAVQARARLQLLEDADLDARRAERSRRLARADAALDDRTAAAWPRA